MFFHQLLEAIMPEPMPLTEPAEPTLDVTRMRRSADQAVGLLRLLSHPDRLMLLCQLTDGERCVGELQDQLDIQQPGLSQQLGVLRRKGLVKTRRDGKHIYYSVADQRALTVLQLLYGLFCNTAAAPADPCSDTN
jgi:DNA-binding transcriptional ArsR family regulator